MITEGLVRATIHPNRLIQLVDLLKMPSHCLITSALRVPMHMGTQWVDAFANGWASIMGSALGRWSSVPPHRATHTAFLERRRSTRCGLILRLIRRRLLQQ